MCDTIAKVDRTRDGPCDMSIPHSGNDSPETHIVWVLYWCRSLHSYRHTEVDGYRYDMRAICSLGERQLAGREGREGSKDLPDLRVGTVPTHWIEDLVINQSR